jgi:hypothetical protein
MQPTKSPGVDVTRPNTATMGDFEDRPALDMLPDEFFHETDEGHSSLFRRRNILLTGAAALIVWSAVIALAITVF